MISMLALLSLFLLCRTALGLDSQQSPPAWPGGGRGRRGAVSSLDSRCTAVGVEILNRGGNAADAVRTSPLFLLSMCLAINQGYRPCRPSEPSSASALSVGFPRGEKRARYLIHSNTCQVCTLRASAVEASC